MMKEVVCNYAVVRFLPYRETGEFVNVGVVLMCPQLRHYAYRVEHRRHKRVTDFFPELEVEVFKTGLDVLICELTRVTGGSVGTEAAQYVFPSEYNQIVNSFQELVRTRESLFHFGEVRTLLTTDPKMALQELFDHYVRRQFALEREYMETVMRRRLGEFLKQHNLHGYYKVDQRVGDDTYHVIVPFVYQQMIGDRVDKAIKPLDLDRRDPSDIYRHGDNWISVVRRLRKINRLPKEFIFTISAPESGDKRRAACTEIEKELRALDALTVSYRNRQQILNIARVPA